MANGFDAQDFSDADVVILTKQVAHSGLGITGQEQVVIQADGVSGQNLAAVDSGGAQLVDQRNSATATIANKTSSASNQTLIASNSARRGAMIYNNSTQVLYVNLGASATTTTAFVVALAAGAYYEVPFGYTGSVTGIWASANGSAQVTEITA